MYSGPFEQGPLERVREGNMLLVPYVCEILFRSIWFAKWRELTDKERPIVAYMDEKHVCYNSMYLNMYSNPTIGSKSRTEKRESALEHFWQTIPPHGSAANSSHQLR